MLVVSMHIFLVAFFASVIMVPLLRRWATQHGKLDQPGERKVHVQAIPRLGGVAIFISLLFSVLVFVEMTREVRGLLAGAMVVFIIGLLDDLVQVSARQKLIGQIAAAVLTSVISGLVLQDLGDLFGLGPIHLPLWLAYPFTVFAVVGVTNALNMIDGLDGLAGGISVLALSAFFLLYLQTGDRLGMAFCAALAGASIGFLKHNSYPATIFMGDAGSLVLGFLMAFFAIDLTQGDAASVKPVVPLLILGLPIIDTVKVMLRRLMQHKSPFAADMTHVHHRVLSLGLDHRFTVLLIYCLTFLSALFALLFRNAREYILLGGYVLALIAIYAIIRYAMNHADRFRFMDKDSSAGLRESRVYRRVVDTSRWLVPILLLCVLAYLLNAVIVSKEMGETSLQLGVAFLLGGLLLGLIPSVNRDRYSMVYYVAASLLLIVVTEYQCHARPMVSGIDCHLIGNVVFTLIAVLVLLKLVFRRGDELYLSSPLDLLFLGLTLSLALFPGEVSSLYRLPTTIVKAVFFVVALKILVQQGQVYRRLAYWGLTGSLGLMLLRNYLV